MLTFVADSAATLTTRYGNVTKATVGAIQRRLLVLEDQGGGHFFGEPAFDIHDLIRTTRDDRGYVSILAADRLMQSPRLYARSEEHTSELQSLMRISYAVFCLKKKTHNNTNHPQHTSPSSTTKHHVTHQS